MLEKGKKSVEKMNAYSRKEILPDAERISLPHWGVLHHKEVAYFSGEGKFLAITEEEPGVFVVVDENITPDKGHFLTFSSWDSRVRDIDRGQSDASSAFGLSEYLKFKDVDMTVQDKHTNGHVSAHSAKKAGGDTALYFFAPSLSAVEEALEHVTVCAWKPSAGV